MIVIILILFFFIIFFLISILMVHKETKEKRSDTQICKDYVKQCVLEGRLPLKFMREQTKLVREQRPKREISAVMQARIAFIKAQAEKNRISYMDANKDEDVKAAWEQQKAKLIKTGKLPAPKEKAPAKAKPAKPAKEAKPVKKVKEAQVKPAKPAKKVKKAPVEEAPAPVKRGRGRPKKQ